MVSRYRGRVYAWHAVLEPFGDPHWAQPMWKENLLLATFGPGYIEAVFEVARAADPAAKLCLLHYQLAWGMYELQYISRRFSELSIENAERVDNCPWKMMILYLKMAIYLQFEVRSGVEPREGRHGFRNSLGVQAQQQPRTQPVSTQCTPPSMRQVRHFLSKVTRLRLRLSGQYIPEFPQANYGFITCIYA